MVIEFFDDSKNFAPILKMGRKKVDVDDDINQRNIRKRNLLDVKILLGILERLRSLKF